MGRKTGKITRMKKPDLTTKVGKYFMAVQKGKTKKEAQIVAGYSTPTHATSIERSKEFQALQTYFKTSFLQKMSMDEVADALIDNIKQENEEKIDRAARNGAIKIALDKLEPQNQQISDEADKVLIVLK